jgi:hypothetical protein
VARFPEDVDQLTLQHYRQGKGVDPLSGAEEIGYTFLSCALWKFQRQA